MNQYTTAELTQELSKRTGVKTFQINLEEKVKITTGAMSTEVEGPVMILINRD
ncbi:BC1881 family protein [Pseudolactococcus carnosus]|uniref:BC1881 family protein n=1 Tax=Pseudolactococcus carnosus TaxID=2749961 RepID=UPI001FBA7D72|nr:BC1881 family protein [Lactococcus carnosus]MCJ2003308.1 BC1881 family protein [Lactococcus carnosus]